MTPPDKMSAGIGTGESTRHIHFGPSSRLVTYKMKPFRPSEFNFKFLLSQNFVLTLTSRSNSAMQKLNALKKVRTSRSRLVASQQLYEMEKHEICEKCH